MFYYFKLFAYQGLLISSAYNLGKQFGPRLGQTESLALSGSKLFDTLRVCLKEIFNAWTSDDLYLHCFQKRIYDFEKVIKFNSVFVLKIFRLIKYLHIAAELRLCWHIEFFLLYTGKPSMLQKAVSDYGLHCLSIESSIQF